MGAGEQRVPIVCRVDEANSGPIFSCEALLEEGRTIGMEDSSAEGAVRALLKRLSTSLSVCQLH